MKHVSAETTTEMIPSKHMYMYIIVLLLLFLFVIYHPRIIPYITNNNWSTHCSPCQ